LTTLLNGKKSNTLSYFKYKGSLTKPPCTEQVDWFVMKYPSTLSTAQLSALKTYGLETARINPDNIRNV
jgi:carbonic anhydrase